MKHERILSWFSCGAASAVATKLAIVEHGARVVPTYCETNAEHADNERFLRECEAWFGVPVTRIGSDKYADTWDVWTKRRYLAGIDGALCTVELKIGPRLAFQHPYDEHVFGYTADANDVERSRRFQRNYPEVRVRFPLIERGINKAACLAMIRSAGIAPPVTYAMGFQNNNCIPCVKATSADYWALVRLRFPAEFERMAKLSRDLDVRLTRIAGERAFIDEIPTDQPTTRPIVPSCDFLCAMAEEDMGIQKAERT